MIVKLSGANCGLYAGPGTWIKLTA